MCYNDLGDFMLIDTHCHLEKEYYEDLEAVLKRMPGVMITAGCDCKSNQEVLERIKNENVYGVIGIHPEFVDSYQEEDLLWIEKHIQDPKIVGIGEIGLDYHYDETSKKKQKELFEKQIKLAEKYHKTVVVHSRDAIYDTYEIMMKHPDVKYVLHCYGSTIEMAKRFLSLSIRFGIGGVVTFKNGEKLKEVVKELPLAYLLLETDSPYLAPEPFRGKKNEPSYTDIIASKIAEIKDLKKEEVIQITALNAIDQFDLPISL